MRSIHSLYRKARKGDAEAYGELFRQHEAELYRTAFVYLRNREDALDAVQESAYRSFRSIKSLKDPQLLKSWLIRIVIRCSIDVLRRRRGTVPADPALLEASGESVPFDPALALELRELIEQLDEDEKSVVLLRYYHDLTIRETAELLEKPLGTVKTVLYRALRNLRLEAEEGESDEG